MQGSTGQSGNQNGQKQGGLSWTQSPSSTGASSNTTNNNNAGGAKPISQVQPSAVKPTHATPAKAPSMPSNSSVKNDSARQGSGARTAGIFIAGVLVGLIIGWGWFSLGRDNGSGEVSESGSTTSSNANVGASDSLTAPNASNTETGSHSSGEAMGGSGSGTSSSGAVGSASGLSVSSQVAGLTVSVASVSVSVPTWVVIFENANGVPGNALGAKLFFPGDKTGTVELLRGTVAGKMYFAGEYVDNGDHQFSKQDDTKVETVAGTPLLVQFTAR